jgi:hypothetical protein
MEDHPTKIPKYIVKVIISVEIKATPPLEMGKEAC